MSTGSSQFWQTRRGLIWSNPKAGGSAHIRAALLRPRFGQLLDIALEFGLERLRAEWAVLDREGTAAAQRARRRTDSVPHRGGIRPCCHLTPSRSGTSSNPPTLAEMKAFFVSQRDQWEVELAAEAKRRQQPGDKGAPGSG